MKQPDLPDTALVAQSLSLFRQRALLIHCMTNDVVQSFTANVLLALHASPAMVIDAGEAAQFSAIADALLINVGTLTHARAEAMQASVQSACASATPWTLDPVAVGALDMRSAFCQQLLALKPAAIRGNASEILALSLQQGGGRGVDTRHQAEEALAAAQHLAQRCQSIVVITGEVDYVTDGERTFAVPGGSPLMTRVVGTGCALSAVVAGFTALPGDRLQHVASACRVMACAGAQAASEASGPGSFLPAFLDALWNLNEEKLK